MSDETPAPAPAAPNAPAPRFYPPTEAPRAELRMYGTPTAEETAKAEEAWIKRAEDETELQRQQAEYAARDDVDRNAASRTMREHWGSDNYHAKRLAITDALSTLPESQREAILNARTADGTALCNTPRGLDMLDRLAQITKYMREDRAAYNKSESTQREYRELIGSLIQAGQLGQSNPWDEAAVQTRHQAEAMRKRNGG